MADQATAQVVNDVHSRLNPTRVDEVVVVDSLDAIRTVLGRARSAGTPICASGGRHAMGGQQFCSDGILVDTKALGRVLGFDRGLGTIEVEAGIQWPELLRFLHGEQQGSGRPWAIRQKQTGADRLSIGGALSANIHGRGLTLRPFVADLESLVLVDSSGEVRTCSRSESPELFRLVVGGYGLFGIVYSATLRLVPRRTLERVVEIARVDELVKGFEQRVGAGFLYGDFQFAIDPRSDDFLRRGVFSCYRPIDGKRPIPDGQRALSRDDWARLLYLAHADKTRAFEEYARHYLATSGQLYLSDAHQFADYMDGYHRGLDLALRSAHPGSEMISELFVPRGRLADFMQEAAEELRRLDGDVVYGTIRLIEKDEETFLAWAREPWACVIFNLHVEHTPAGLARSAESFRRLIELARARGGSYYLTYHRWATREQVEACYPRFPEFLRRKREHDPDELFQSDRYRHHAKLFGLQPGAELEAA